MISLSAVVNFVLYVVVAGLIFWLLDWLIRYVGVPEPFAKVARIVLAVAAVFVLIYALMGLIGFAGPLFRP
jgi:hypothetical protein